MRVGLNLPQYEIDFAGRPQRIVEAARAADEAGFDSVWVSDHPFAIAPDGTMSGALDALVSMGHIAAATSRVTIGSLVLACSMRSVEDIVSGARELASIEPGRIVLGLGAGWFEAEHRAYGAELPSWKQRLRTLDETTAAARESGVEILIGGSGAGVLDIAARRADIWNCSWDVSPQVFEPLSASLDGACSRAGRDPRSVRRSVGVTVLLGDRVEAERATERVRGRAPFLSSLRLDVLEKEIIVGDAATCARAISAYGADEVVITAFVRDDLDMIRTIGRELIPRL